MGKKSEKKKMKHPDGITLKELRIELRTVRKRMQSFCRENGHEIYGLFDVLKSFCEQEFRRRREESAPRA